MTTFEDHFSKQARDYARYRPQYPDELFGYLASIAPARRLAWDCGTGNGQAALGLVRHFEHVVATDASADQVGQAVPHERIDFRVERAEAVGLESGSVDLVTVATAVHWFDLPRFYAEARRVATSGGVLAVWTYFQFEIAPAIDPIMTRYHAQVLGDYWPKGFHHVVDRYRTLPFPFDEIPPPELEVRSLWTLRELSGFLNSWSATQRYLEQRGDHPLRAIWPALSEAWGDPDQPRPIRWPLYLRVGRVR
jgi:SAM-dependent methyltransferase